MRSFNCTECSSKNTGMIAMHVEPGNMSCFRCHKGGKIRPDKKSPGLMITGLLCVGCHGGQGP